MEQLLFTPSAILNILLQIDELQDKEIGITETLDGNLQLTIGESDYILEPSELQTTLHIDDEEMSEIQELSEETYQDLADSNQIDLQLGESVESGIIKEIAKTLLVGGVVRLTGKKFKDLFK